MRAKIQALIDGHKPADEDFRRVLAFPDHARSEADMVHFTLDSDVPSREMMLATEIRSALKSAPAWRNMAMPTTVSVEKGKGKAVAKGRGTRTRKKDEGEVDEEEIIQSESESEGEEVELVRAEMLEAQVAATVANRDAMDEDEDGKMDDDEDSGAE
jgi:general transcription factor 3C polypeptide 5 (transcription factor C subunit 1)